MSTFYAVVRPILVPLVKMVWAPRISGVENLPTEGPFLVASNHIANVDSFVLPIAAPRQVRFIAKDTYWKKRGPIGFIQRHFFDAVGTVPVDRDTLSSGRGALDVAVRVLRDGDGFGIYPEGTRSRDGRLYRGRPGVAWLALEADCPVIPVGLKGTPELFAKGRWWRARKVVSVRFGEPVDFSGIDPSLSKGARRREMTDLVMDRIAELSGQERTDELNHHAPAGM